MATQGNEWKVHMTMKPKVMLPTDSNEKRMMYSKSHRSIFMIGQRLLVMIQTKSFKYFLVHVYISIK